MHSKINSDIGKSHPTLERLTNILYKIDNEYIIRHESFRNSAIRKKHELPKTLGFRQVTQAIKYLADHLSKKKIAINKNILQIDVINELKSDDNYSIKLNDVFTNCDDENNNNENDDALLDVLENDFSKRQETEHLLSEAFSNLKEFSVSHKSRKRNSFSSRKRESSQPDDEETSDTAEGIKSFSPINKACSIKENDKSEDYSTFYKIRIVVPGLKNK